MDQYKHLVASSIAYAKEKATNEDDQVKLALEKLAVTFGAEILKIIPGRVSTELDARLSYDKEATLAKCKELYAMYEEVGINPREKFSSKLQALGREFKLPRN